VCTVQQGGGGAGCLLQLNANMELYNFESVYSMHVQFTCLECNILCALRSLKHYKPLL
jgi:hypothetical protein